MMNKNRVLLLLAISFVGAVIVGGLLARFTEKVTYRTYHPHVSCEAVDDVDLTASDADIVV